MLIMNAKKSNYAWYAVYTKPNREKRIIKELLEDNIECYLPVTNALKQWTDRKKWIEEPLFRSYIFVRVSYVEFFNVLNAQGVVCYVSFGGKPQTIPDYQIENIKTLVKQEEKEIILTKERIAKGSKAIVQFGPLKGVQGEVVQICGQSRILIRIDTLGCSLHTNISIEEIKLIAPETLSATGRKLDRHTKASKNYMAV